MKSKFFILFFALIFCFSNLCPVFATAETSPSATAKNAEDKTDTDKTQKSKEDDELTLSAASAILMDAKTGKVLYEKDAYSKQFPASITKVMTVLLALEKGSLSDKITFSHEAVSNVEPGSASIGIQEGETLTLEQVIFGILLRSANECANAAAEYVDGSLDKFAKHMTSRAKELGCKNTNFVNANGLFDENHYTTAYDMALIARELLKNETYRKIMSETHYQIPPTNLQEEERNLHGQHQMLNPPSIYYYEWATGGKTGYTTESNNTLVTFAEKDGMELIAVVLKCNGAEHYVDTKALFAYGFSHFKTVNIVSAKDVHEKINVTETYKDKTTVKDVVTLGLKKDIYATIPIDTDISKIKKEITHKKTVSAPIKKGATLGKLTLSLDGEVLATANLHADKAVAATTPAERKEMEKAAAIKTAKRIATIIAAIIGGIIIVFLVTFAVCRYIGYRNWKKRCAKRNKRRN